MGGGLYADKGAIDPGALDARREFQLWFVRKRPASFCALRGRR